MKDDSSHLPDTASSSRHAPANSSATPLADSSAAFPASSSSPTPHSRQAFRPSPQGTRLPRSAASRLENAPQSLPRRSMSACPCCHEPIQNTTLHCLHCGAEKHYGPLRRESLLYALAGLILLLALTRVMLPWLLWPLSPWLIPLMLAGLGIGFIFAQFRFARDRWISPRKD